MNQEKIGKFIALCRKEKKLTQSELAEKLQITNKAVSKWETGRGMPDASLLLDLCDILGISVNELLSGEKIDIFVWKSNPIDLIAEALTPARVVSVMPDEKEKRALVIANDDQFSLAIGRNGQNAKLAAFATGWKIDIKKLSEAYTEGIDFRYNVNC